MLFFLFHELFFYQNFFLYLYQYQAVPGYDVKIIKPDHSIAEPNEMGDIVVKLPLPPGTFPTLGMQTKDMKKII